MIEKGTVQTSLTLETWLSIATKNLAPRAAAKVREDITAHFESSVEHHQLEGMNELEARALAVRELGDAASSAKGFERVYLTSAELNMFVRGRTFWRKARWTWLIHLVLVITYVLTAALTYRTFDILVFLLTGTICFGIRWHTANNPDLKAYAAGQTLVGLLMGAGLSAYVAIVLFRFGPPSAFLQAVFGVTLVVWIVYLRNDFVRLRKIQLI